MSAHLPECQPESVPIPCPDGKPGCGVMHYEQRRTRCICDRLRACEQRVLDEHSEVDAYRGWVKGYSDGVQAARDAAEIALLGTLQSTRDRVLAAIDALRGDA